MKKEKRKKIGLALGGGGARGLAHVGVIRVLVEAGLPIDYIAGTSIGALVGGFYAATGDLDLLDQTFSRLRRKDIASLGKVLVRRDGALFRDASVPELLGKAIARKSVEDCAIPFAAVATDVKNGDAVVMRTGSMDTAIRASIALPLIFQPVKRDDRLLMDGGFSDPVPADVVRQMGADYVIAVDVTSQWVNTADEKVSWSNLYDIVSNALSVIEYQLSREILKQADLVLRPAVLQHSWLAFDRAGELIVAGADAAREEVKAICNATGYELPDETPIERLIDFLRGR